MREPAAFLGPTEKQDIQTRPIAEVFPSFSSSCWGKSKGVLTGVPVKPFAADCCNPFELQFVNISSLLKLKWLHMKDSNYTPNLEIIIFQIH